MQTNATTLCFSTTLIINEEIMGFHDLSGPVYGTTNTVYGTTNADAEVGIGLKKGIQKFDKRKSIN